MIANFPLWMIIVIWFLQRSTAPRLTIYNYPIWLRLVSDMRAFLPVPRNWWERRMVREVLAMMDLEAQNIHQLVRLGAIGSGVRKKG
jgi:hypothetical protein